jgi:hypothetical protein
MRVLLLGAATLAAGIVAMNTVPADLSAQVLADEMRPESGKYQASLTLVSLDMPDAPPEIANMMGQMLSREFDYCLTPEDVEEGYQSVMNRAQQGECSYQRFNASGGSIDAEMTCDVEGREMNMVMQGSGTPTASDITMTMTGDMGMGQGSMTMRIVQERVGAC